MNPTIGTNTLRHVWKKAHNIDSICRMHRSLLSSSSFVPQVDNNRLPSSQLIDFQIAAKIEGEESHVVTIKLHPGEVLRAEAGAMLFMTEGVVMDTKLGGASEAFSRMLTGQNVFLTDYRYEGETSGTVCLGTDFPSKILRFYLQDMPDNALICQRGAYLASNANVNIEMEFTKSLSAGFFGGQGFILQRLSGEGDVLVKGGGTIVKRELADGEKLCVTSGSIVAFESTVQYDIQMMPGIKNVMFGGEGLFVTTLQGPGNIWLQGMPPDRMIAEIARRVPSGPGIGFGVPLGGASGGSPEEAGGEATEGVAVGDTASTTEGLASEEGILADRQATVASSSMSDSAHIDSESTSSLFGDAAPASASTESGAPADGAVNDPFATESFSKSEQPTFADEEFSSSEFDQFGSQDGDFFDDTDSSPPEDVGLGGEGGESSGTSSLLGTLWDFFMGGNDE